MLTTPTAVTPVFTQFLPINPFGPGFGPLSGLGALGAGVGDLLKQEITSGFDSIMQVLWGASLELLKAAFTLADQFTAFHPSTTAPGPLKVLWPVMVWVSGALALGLFFWQLASTNLRGGRGFLRLVVGPAQYGVTLAVSVGMVAGVLAAVDGLTTAILSYGLNAQSFTDAYDHTNVATSAQSVADAIVLGICALVGVIPAAVGYAVEMLFREAAIYVLLAAIPIAAAGLLATATSTWLWRAVRWLAAAIAMKPALALALVISVGISGGAQGIAGMLVGVMVLMISLFCPFVLFRLFAFVDPNTDAGASFRRTLSGLGIDSYGGGNPALQAAGALDNYANSDGGDGNAVESANDSRFGGGGGGGEVESFIQRQRAERAARGRSPFSPSGGGDPDTGSETGESGGDESGSGGPGGGGPDGGSGGGGSGGGGPDEEGGSPMPPPLPPDGGPHGPDGPPGGDGGGGGSSGGGGGEAGEVGDAAEAAVIL